MNFTRNEWVLIDNIHIARVMRKINEWNYEILVFNATYTSVCHIGRMKACEECRKELDELLSD